MVQRKGIYYLRKSIRVTSMSDEDSVKYQLVEIERYCFQNQIQLVKGFSDVGYSGSNTNRPELQEMLSFLRSSQERVNVLVFYSIDRLGRDLRDNITLMKEISNYVEQVVFIREGTTSDSAGFKIIFTLLTAVAQESRVQIKKNLANGRKAKVLFFKNHHGSRTPIGYTRLKKKLVAASELTTKSREEVQGFKILEHIFYSYLLGDSLAQIAASLNQYYGPTSRGKDWGFSSVRWILSNPIYIGTLKGSLESKSYIIEHANVQKLIDPFVFEFIQQRLACEGKGRPRKGPLTRNPHFTLCYHCGTMLKQEKNLLKCENCKCTVAQDNIYQAFIEESLKLIKSNYDCKLDKNDLMDTLRTQKSEYALKKAQHDEALKKLTIMTGITANEKNDMHFKLNNKLHSVGRKLLIAEELIDFLTDKSLADLTTKKVQEDLLIKLPYLIVVNFRLNQIDVIFHREVFIDVRD